MPDCTISRDLAASQSAWQASLTLGFADDGGTTRLLDKLHYGPLRVQKALYPEDRKVCQAIIVHPPGGVVGGDQLEIDIGVGNRAHAFITTPGAAKWYKANGKVSRQSVHLHVNQDAALEWLPQETIFFDTADVLLEQDVELAEGATFLGCEILCMGRRGSGEIFNTGRIRQRSSIRREGRLIWWEQGDMIGGRLDSPLALKGHTVCATLIAAGKPLPASVLNEIRADIAADGEHIFGVTQTKGVLVARHLGDDSETARHLMLAVWRRLRPYLLQREAVTPRIWQT
ncbi:MULTISPECIES: urease accessory protein UreD [unclassified Duganella]|jgi:urease accessory protein|uniref:urease accessory protein UreD n=1 Tax=unclassified Duganella TaxID=2636909 RepID=UPI0008906608|nr:MULTISPECIES: urease accessory protein UreD [unclassified Duganella]SDF61522.1 urease accessory protein [Duganella sp. OV458]SDI66993.1 urease accessory protein [Duganella sp. OV510]